MILSLMGVALIALQNLMGTSAASRDVLKGDLLEVGAVLSWGAYLTLNKPLINKQGALPTLTATFLIGSLLDIPVALLSMPGWPPLSTISTTAWLSLGYLALFATIGGLAFQNLSLKSLEASQVAAFGNGSPLLTVLWGYLLFNEQISLLAAIGGGLVLAGIFCTSWVKRPRPSPSETHSPEIRLAAEPSA